MENPIDAVISWVDGDDPAHKRKMKPYLEQLGRITDDSSAPTRFRSVGEIFFCVASILRFAPFVRTIYIVTDQQDPHLEDFVNDNFPENKIPIVIVDHTVIFRGYEQYLPIFSSRSIETCVFRIPGLSENYIYFNDDFLLARLTDREDWFIEGKAIARGRWKSYAWFNFLSRIKPPKDGRKPFGFKDGMMSAAKELGMTKRFFLIGHTPHSQKKSVVERYYAHNPQSLIANLSHRFRDRNQYNPQVLSYLLGLQSGECVARNEKPELLYMKPVGRGKGYVKRKMRQFEKQNPKFICVGSLDLATEEDRKAIEKWLEGVLSIVLPSGGSPTLSAGRKISLRANL